MDVVLEEWAEDFPTAATTKTKAHGVKTDQSGKKGKCYLGWFAQCSEPRAFPSCWNARELDTFRAAPVDVF